jgi:transcriptional regulator with AAA-type ATPase domain
MQLHPQESKSSLKFYLEINNLPSKDDMPIKDLFGYYYTGNVKGLTEVVHYCYIDCFRLHQLTFQNNIIQDRRSVSSIAYTSMFDALYRANSAKVRNLIIANALDKNLFVNNIKKEELEEEKMEGKFTGAMVLNPRRGLVKNVMTFEEFAKDQLHIDDQELINQVQEVINKNYEAIYIDKDVDKVKFD